MGGVLQLLLFGVAYCVLAIIIGFGIVVVFWLYLHSKKIKGISRILSQGFFLPLSLAPYFFIVTIVSIIICEVVREVDAPFSDYWTIPVDAKINVIAIDSTREWWFSPVAGGQAISEAIQSIAVTEKMVYGATLSGFNYIYSFQSQRYMEYDEYAEFSTRLNDHGITRIDVLSPEAYYWEQRKWGDIIMLLLFLIYPIYRYYCLVINLRDLGSQDPLSESSRI